MTCSSSVFVAALASLLASACSAAPLFSEPVEAAGVHYDPQECVEHALRHDPDPEGVRGATIAFPRACQEGEAAACSALGVMYELGRGVPVDRLRAAQLYGVACEAHNRRGCDNLRAMMVARADRVPGEL